MFYRSCNSFPVCVCAFQLWMGRNSSALSEKPKPALRRLKSIAVIILLEAWECIYTICFCYYVSRYVYLYKMCENNTFTLQISLKFVSVGWTYLKGNNYSTSFVGITNLIIWVDALWWLIQIKVDKCWVSYSQKVCTKPLHSFKKYLNLAKYCTYFRVFSTDRVISIRILKMYANTKYYIWNL